MSSDDMSVNGRSASTVANESPERSFLLSEFRRRQLVGRVSDESAAPRDRAVAAMARVQQDIDRLWRDSITAENSGLSARLLDVSHALQRAARLLTQDTRIG
jgi:hypothetical protein